MAESRGGESKRFKEHPIVAKLRADPGKEAERTVRLMGYVGRSGQEGRVRVYPTLDDLSQYLEIREEDIVHSEDVPDTVMEHGASSLWVKGSAELVHHQTQTETVQAQFLGGGIAQENLRDFPGSAGGQIQWPHTIYHATCRYTCYRTCIFKTCYGTCHFSCFATCYVTCARTCNYHLTCGRTCIQVTCYRTCNWVLCRPTIFNRTCICEIEPFDRFDDPTGGGGDPFGGGGGPWGGGSGGGGLGGI